MINAIINIIGPVALIVMAGFVVVKLKLFPREGIRFVMNYAQNFAVPLLLFNAMRNIDFGNSFRFDILASYFIPAFICFGLGWFLARIYGRGPAAAVVLGFNALFANSLLLGLPLSERAFGADSLLTNYVVLAVHSPLNYTIGAIAMEIARPKPEGFAGVIKQTFRELSRNPLIIGILCGVMVNLTGLTLPRILDDAIDTQSRAALPVALFGLGGVLTGLKLGGSVRLIVMISALQLILLPSLVLILADRIIGLEIGIVKTLVFIAALPTGVNGYIFASLYGREEETAASIVFFSTLISLLSLPLWLWALSQLG